jgi:arylsulfatase A-like enzyme
VVPLDGIIGSPAFFAAAVRRGLEIDHLLSRPKPHLAIYLHRTPEALFAGERPPEIEKWNQLGEVRLWQYRHCQPQLLSGHPVKDDGTGWYLFRFEEDRLLECRRQVRAERPDLILVVIDTLRPDRLELYGHDRETAPFLARLGRESAVFENAISSSSWTAPSTASLFSGLYPSRHGIRMGIHAHKALMKEVEANGLASLPVDLLPEDVALLPELLRTRGYSSFGISTNLNVGKEMGFTRGFDRFERENMAPASFVEERLRDWKAEILSTRPFFLYLHLNDVHAPYDARPPWFRASGDARADTRAAYDSEIRYVDEMLQRVARDFDRDGDGVWVVLSDHGEEFWERGELGHLFSLHAEVNRIPLLIRAPVRGVEPRRIAQNVSLVDLLPTLLALAGPGPQPAALDGISLVPLMTGDGVPGGPQEATGDRPLFAHRLHRLGTGQELWSVVQGRWKLIEGPRGSHLFDLATDPGEQNDVSALAPERVAGLAHLLEQHRAGSRSSSHASPTGAELEIDAERLEELRRLGYAEEP